MRHLRPWCSLACPSICRDSMGDTFLLLQNTDPATTLAPQGQAQGGCRRFSCVGLYPWAVAGTAQSCCSRKWLVLPERVSREHAPSPRGFQRAFTTLFQWPATPVCCWIVNAYPAARLEQPRSYSQDEYFWVQNKSKHVTSCLLSWNKCGRKGRRRNFKNTLWWLSPNKGRGTNPQVI